jgi:DNA-directed RNA polymerase alpha subunit
MAKDVEKPFTTEEVRNSKDLPFRERLEFSISQLGVSTSTQNKLDEEMGVIWIRQLQGVTHEQVMSIGNFGQKMMAGLQEKLAIAGVRWESSGKLTDLFVNGNGTTH